MLKPAALGTPLPAIARCLRPVRQLPLVPADNTGTGLCVPVQPLLLVPAGSIGTARLAQLPPPITSTPPNL